jgi:hypothetical protein
VAILFEAVGLIRTDRALEYLCEESILSPVPKEGTVFHSPSGTLPVDSLRTSMFDEELILWIILVLHSSKSSGGR